MPAPSRTSREAIVVAARAILEADGLDAVSMQAVAERVGVRAPSLYKHVADRTALLRAVTEAVAADLAVALEPGGTGRAKRRGPDAGARGDDAIAQDELRDIARRYRAFVRAQPTGYGLLFTRLGPGSLPDDRVLAALGAPIVAVTGRLVGPDRALDAARAFVAWAHGFTSLEQAGGFRLGGDLDAAYANGIELILAGISAPATRSAR